MAGKPWKPKLSFKDLYGEISARTYISPAIVKTVIEALSEIVVQSILNRVDVPVAGLGKFMSVVIAPCELVEWNGFNEERERVLFYREKADGYMRLVFKASPTLRRKIKQISKIPYGSMPPRQNAIEKNPLSETRINYDEWLKNHWADKYASDEEYVEYTQDNLEYDEYESVEDTDEN